MAAPNLKLVHTSEEVVEQRVADLDDGFTRLATTLLEEYAGADLTKRQFKVLLAVLRMTYGWNKPHDRIANSQIAEITKLPIKRVSETRVQLVEMNILKKTGNHIGPNKNISEWAIPQNEGLSPKLRDKKSPETRERHPSKQGDTIDIIPKTLKTTTPIPPEGAVKPEENTTPTKQKKSSALHFDRERIQGTWNAKAEKLGLPKIRSITATIEAGLVRLYKAHLKQCKDTGREPRDMDTFINGYIEFGYQPTKWAMGENPDGKRYGIDTALRQTKIDEIIGMEA